jgi:hypothetical protein
MSSPISTNSLKKLILKSDNPKQKIELLLRTLPYTIMEESKRRDMNIEVVKNLVNKLSMVKKLSVDIV